MSDTRFFMNKHYSTAQKVIEIIEKKINSDMGHHPKLKKASPGHDDFTYLITIANIRKLAVVLGDVLKDSLPKEQYKKYQSLQENEKKELREKIAEDYYGSLLTFTKNLENIVINVSSERDKYIGIDIHAEVSFPQEFFDKDKLANQLHHATSSVRQDLIIAGNTSLQYQQNDVL